MEIDERAVGDLQVIVWVTPTPDAAGGVRIPEGAVLEVRCICQKID